MIKWFIKKEQGKIFIVDNKLQGITISNSEIGNLIIDLEKTKKEIQNGINRELSRINGKEQDKKQGEFSKYLNR